MDPRPNTLLFTDLIKFKNVYSYEQENDPSPSFCELELPVKNWLLSIGMPFAYVSVHSGSVAIEVYEKFSMTCKEDFNTLIAPLKFEPCTFNATSIDLEYDGKFKAARHGSHGVVRGYAIVFISAQPELNGAFEKGAATVRDLANRIRLCYGIQTIGPSKYRCAIDIVSSSCQITSNSLNFSPEHVGSGNDISSWASVGLSSGDFARSLPLDAGALFDKALSEGDLNYKFLFLWLCFEVVAGDGAKRMKLFKTKLRSSVANGEVYRLFLLRCGLAHQGRAPIASRDWLSLMWALRLAVFALKSDQKERAVSSYENWIRSQ